MADLIDREALLEALEYDPAKRDIVQPKSTFGIILDAPAVDAVEVVRCMECKCGERDIDESWYFCYLRRKERR